MRGSCSYMARRFLWTRAYPLSIAEAMRFCSPPDVSTSFPGVTRVDGRIHKTLNFEAQFSSLVPSFGPEEFHKARPFSTRPLEAASLRTSSELAPSTDSPQHTMASWPESWAAPDRGPRGQEGQLLLATIRLLGGHAARVPARRPERCSFVILYQVAVRGEQRLRSWAVGSGGQSL